MTDRERRWFKFFHNVEFGLDLFIKLGTVGVLYHAAYVLAILGNFLQEVLQ